MNVFEDIIASILIDIIKAQDRANKYSAELIPQYRDPTLPNLGFLPVPNTAIKSFDVKLSFAVDDFFPSGPPTGEVYKSLFSDINKVLAEIFDATGAVLHPKKNEDNNRQEVFSKLQQLYLVLLGDNKRSQEEKADMLAQQIVKEMQNVFATDYSVMEREKITAQIMNLLQANLKFSYERGLPVILDLDVLKDAGDKILASVNCQVDMRNYQLGFTEPLNGSGEMPRRASVYQV